MDTPDYIHPEYDAMKGKWQRCRDAVAGQDAVHKAGQSYLPMLSGQTPIEYNAYKQRTPFFNASGRTLDGLVGMVFRKDPHTEVPAAMQAYLDDITLSGVTMHGLARDVLTEIQTVGRCGVLVEYPRVQEQPANLAQALAINLRPYATLYKTEAIINWRVQRINNQMMPVLVVLIETYEVGGEFQTEYKPQLRVLRLVEGTYIQQIWRMPEDKASFELVEEITPLMNGRPMAAIPFYIFGSQSLTWQIDEPPLLDLIDLNLSHYRNSADLEHGAHFTGLPTPFIAGVMLGDGESISIGSSKAIVAPDPQAKASYLEFSGSGLGSIEKLLDRKEAMMAAIGARMLAPEKSAAEAAQTLEMRSNGETSVLAAQARLVSQGLTAMLEIMREWAGIAGTCVYQLSTDYLPVRMTAQELTALVGAWQQGAISTKTLFFNLQQGEIVETGKTFEDEQSDIDMQGPSLTDQ